MSETDVRANLFELRRRIAGACRRAGRSAEEVTLVAVTKTVQPDRVIEAFQAGVRHFGENKVQEAARKLPVLGEMVSASTWHMVGHLQSNKVKHALELFHSIDSVDSVRLARLVDGCARKRTPILLQVNVSAELTKEGFSVRELPDAAAQIREMTHLEVRGLMTVGPLLHDPEGVRPMFRRLRELSDSLGLKELSMGMSDDFEVAIEEGATMVRIGRGIFGERRT